MKNYKRISKTVRELILGGKVRKELIEAIENNLNELNAERLAIRSSGISEDSSKASFAGMYDTFLNVEPQADSVVKYVKKCWAFLFNERALLYSLKQRLTGCLDGMGVVVQRMVQANVSGVVFTVNPSDKNTMLVEFSRGKGELWLYTFTLRLKDCLSSFKSFLKSRIKCNFIIWNLGQSFQS